MKATSIAKIAGVVAACAVVLAVTFLWREYPPPSLGCDCERVWPASEYIAKVTIPLCALIGVAIVASMSVLQRKVLAGAIACASSAMIAVVILSSFGAHSIRGSWLPDPDLVPLLLAGFVAGLLGALVASCLAKWRRGTL